MIRDAPGVLACLALAAALPSSTRAQVSASLAVDTDYRLRGVSLTDGRPALGAALNYDTPVGLYFGGSVVAENAAREGPRLLGHAEYAGFALRGDGDLTWDFGVSNQAYAVRANRAYDLSYTEAYLGVSRRNLSAQVRYSPNYMKSGWNTLYFGLDGAFHPVDGLRLSGHVGRFEPLSMRNVKGGLWSRWDFKATLAKELPRGEVRISWAGVTPATPPQPYTGPSVILGASLYF
jgi:uncharacterized protein (TIGR02001 family)